MLIFFFLNGLGVVFLLYVLAKFWTDGHRPKGEVRGHEFEPTESRKADVIVITHPVSLSAHGGLSEVPFPAIDEDIRGKSERKTARRAPIEMPAKRYSAR